ncbi:MAG: hypothetical protein K2M78_16380 [Lachnospiraceae bacterium]|nr:hypothetical protein [Lachnospiraceae bacterium]
MENRVLIQGRVTSVEHHVINNSELDEFTYEFEYNGVRFEGHLREFTGILWETTPDVGAPIEVYFNTDTQKHKIKYPKIIIRDHDEYGNKFIVSNLKLVLIGISFGILFAGFMLAEVSQMFGLILLGIGVIMFGISPLVEEIRFIIDKKIKNI